VLLGESPHLLLTGGPGIGKTHLVVALYRQLSTVFGTELVAYANVPVFCEEAKAMYGRRQVANPWEGIESARRAVMLDDLFGRELSQHESAQIIYRLIDTIYRNGAALIANMNQDVDELKRRLPPHEISRLLAGCTIINVRAERDWRRK
jgi:DNA replication protein DnaC